MEPEHISVGLINPLIFDIPLSEEDLELKVICL